MGRKLLLGILLALSSAWGLSAPDSPPGAGGPMLVEKENIVDVRLRGAPWQRAELGTGLSIGDRLRTGEFSRAAVRFTDLSVLRVDELTEIQVLPPSSRAGKPTLDVPRGGGYFFSRDKGNEMQIRTPAANGALRGTEFAVRVGASGHTTMVLFEGEVELSNAQGRVVLRSGEQGEADIGKAPRKTAVIDAVNIIQWCLYYPGVIDPSEIPLTAAEKGALAGSLAAYRAGDLLGALAKSRGIGGDGSDGVRIYRAAVMLSTGQVEKARAGLKGTRANQPLRRALEQMIAAVQSKEWKRTSEPRTASEWMAESYYRQSRGNLEAALVAAQKARDVSPEFGFAWARVAELMFSFGRTQDATKALDRGIQLAPRNAQAHALRGFLLSANNDITASRRSFEEAMALDGALGNAWLGRGLTSIRQGWTADGRRDLQTAAALEPNRSILRSYLGKAFSETGNAPKADKELKRAIELDANDPTPWLYSAIQRKQENRYNEAVDDLEKSVQLNDNRRVYRSQFLLDQDRAVRGTNLASIYLNDGMKEQSVREAVRAVNSDYSSSAAHLFLANSYNALRDPTRVLLRYETAGLSELLVSNLLSPVGGGPLSQFVSEQEYSKLFEKDGVGFSSLFEYRSDGQVREVASQYGTKGNLSYSLDGEYQYSSGVRPNNSLSNFEGSATFKLQLGVSDSIFLQVNFGDLRTGDVFQYYDPRGASSTIVQVPAANGSMVPKIVPNQSNLTYRLHDDQDPGLLLLGWHHEWSPGNHTLLLLGRLASDQTVSANQSRQTNITRDVADIAPPNAFPDFSFVGGSFLFTPHFSALRGLPGRGNIEDVAGNFFDFDYQSKIAIYSAELQQIATFKTQTLILGGRYQSGSIETLASLTNFGGDSLVGQFFEKPPARQRADVDFERISLYAYDTWHATPWLSLTGGVTYDSMRYPDNYRNPPINSHQDSLDKVSPKAGIILQPWRGATIRGAYTEAISGASFDESIRLEPTQVAGFLQSYRTITSESLIGSVAGSRYTFSGLSFEQKLPTRTYFGFEYQILSQNVDRTVGVFDFLGYTGQPLGILPSSLAEKDRYRENAFAVTLNQLMGKNWAFGAGYRQARSTFSQQFPEVSESIGNARYPGAVDNLARKADMRSEATLHFLGLHALYNHPCGFFARAEANWYHQDSESWTTDGSGSFYDSAFNVHAVLRPLHQVSPPSDFWQFNILAGYRFYRNRCEVSCGVLNLTGQDYQLTPLNPYDELPRERTFVVRCRLSF